jgi:hypothetical protein
MRHFKRWRGCEGAAGAANAPARRSVSTIGWNREAPGAFRQQHREHPVMEELMADYAEAANLLRILIHKMRGTTSDGGDGTHLDIDISKSEMQRLIVSG